MRVKEYDRSHSIIKKTKTYLYPLSIAFVVYIKGTVYFCMEHRQN